MEPGRPTAFWRPFGDGEYLFFLPILKVAAIEDKAGPIDGVKDRLIHGGWGIHDVVETIKQALLGGAKGLVDEKEVEVGAASLRFRTLTERYIEGQPIAPLHLLAREIIAAFYVGYDEPAAQKKSPKPKASKPPKSSIGESSSTTA